MFPRKGFHLHIKSLHAFLPTKTYPFSKMKGMQECFAGDNMVIKSINILVKVVQHD